MADDYCVHEMLRETCGLCTPRQSSAKRLERRAEPVAGPRFRRAGGPLTAQYESRCPECHDMIEPGEPIVKDPRTDLYVHEGCA